MDDKRRAVISEVAIAAYQARQNLKMMMQLNVPSDPVQAEKHAIASAIALAEAEDTEKALADEIAGVRRIHA